MGAPAVSWFEITGPDARQLQRFYTELFNWPIADAGMADGYGLVQANEGGIGGGIGASQEGQASRVTVYVEVDDPKTYLRKVEQLGGTTILAPTEIREFGLTFALFSDPEGNVVGLSKGAVR